MNDINKYSNKTLSEVISKQANEHLVIYYSSSIWLSIYIVEHDIYIEIISDKCQV